MEQISVKSKLKFTVYTYNESILRAFLHAFLREHLNKCFFGPVFSPKKRKVFCVLRSPFVNKDSRDHFELNLHSATFYSTFSADKSLLKFLRTFFKKLSFRITNNISVEIKKI